MIPKYFNTRFNPTPTGDMHVGHAYLCLVNEHEAHSNGGKFFVRYDDTQFYWRYYEQDPSEMNYWAERTSQDLKWLGIDVDGFMWQSEMQDKAHTQIRDIYGFEVPPERMGYSDIPYVKGLNCMPMPYTSALCMEKVWMDWMMFCDYIIRGIDLITEYALYSYWIDQFRLHHVTHVFLPRLSIDGDDPSYSKGSVSKTHGGYTIRAFQRAGFSSAELRMQLRVACLKDPAGDWSVENVKENPVWSIHPPQEYLNG